ncbi:hypothetical protein BBP40_009059 [Aspergillus hancockii]|nr:hypothetical protein BBP40_009059 [Aspergillus hancockii]
MHLIPPQLNLLITTLSTLLTLTIPTLAYKPISNNTLTYLPRPNTDFNIHTGPILSPILRTRVPGTANSAFIRTHFSNYFTTTLPNWTLETHNSTAKVPSSPTEIPIVNFIAIRDPPGIPKGNISRLTLVAHYDTKQPPPGFIGAIDSAAPCAIIMHAVRSIDAALTRKWAKSPQPEHPVGIQVIFTDGEEALDDNLPDMLYGSRSLAAEWEAQRYPPSSRYPNRVSAISLFVLLDLLGARNPHIASYFNSTHEVYKRAAVLEKRLRSLNLFKSAGSGPWFIDAHQGAEGPRRYPIYDDHVPFMERGVDVLHIIDVDPATGTFPGVWHTLRDNGENLDGDGMGDWGVLVTALVVEWLELEGYLG